MIHTNDVLHLAFIKAVADNGWEHHSVPMTGAALDEFLTSEGFRERLTEALVEVEESRLNGDCLSDSCDHPEGECPDPYIGCGDAGLIVGFMRPRTRR